MKYLYRLLVTCVAAVLAACGQPGLSTLPSGIAAGPDGALWFSEGSAGRIGRMTTGFALTNEFPIPIASSYPYSIAKGPDGAMWFTDIGTSAIGRIDADGHVVEYPLPSRNASHPIGIVPGPGDAMWFVERDEGKVGRIDMSGAITEFAVSRASEPTSIAAAPDGATLWFTERQAHRIGQITPGGRITEIVLSQDRQPVGIAAGPDGAMWFTEFIEGRLDDTGAVARISPSGRITEYVVRRLGESRPEAMVAGTRGDLWFVDADDRIGRVETSGKVALYNIPLPGQLGGHFADHARAMPVGIVLGADGNVWYTASCSNRIGRVTLDGALTEVPISSGVGLSDGDLTCPG
jgi:virginiamycin B lyase